MNNISMTDFTKALENIFLLERQQVYYQNGQIKIYESKPTDYDSDYHLVLKCEITLQPFKCEMYHGGFSNQDIGIKSLIELLSKYYDKSTDITLDNPKFKAFHFENTEYQNIQTIMITHDGGQSVIKYDKHNQHMKTIYYSFNGTDFTWLQAISTLVYHNQPRIFK